LARNVTKKLDVSNDSFAHFTLILLLHYLVKCRSRIVVVYILQRRIHNGYPRAHVSAQTMTDTTKSL